MDTIPSSITVNLRTTSNPLTSIYQKSIRVIFMVFLVFIAYLCNSMWAHGSIQTTETIKTTITTTNKPVSEPVPEPVPDILEQYYIHHDYGSLTEATDNLFNGPLLRTISQN